MGTFIGLLRAVNLGARNQVGMADLRRLVADLGLQDGRTLLQSGNVVFRTPARGGAALERVLESEARSRLGLATDFFVRSATEWKDVLAANPFIREAPVTPGTFWWCS